MEEAAPAGAWGRSRGAEPGVLQALRGCGAALGRVVQRGEEEAGEGGNLVCCPVVPVRQDGVEAAGAEPGDPQESAWRRQRKHRTSVMGAGLRGCCFSPHRNQPEGFLPLCQVGQSLEQRGLVDDAPARGSGMEINEL